MKPRVLVIGLDGHEPSAFEWLNRHNHLPNLARLAERSARFQLDHGPAVRTGLAWEQFITGLSPDDAQKWAAVSFDPATYRVWQEGTTLVPFPAKLTTRTVVFDPPYLDLAKAPEVRGVVAWGAHDPGVSHAANPPGLLDELAARGLGYPAPKDIYGISWQSVEETTQMGRRLARAVDARSTAARWLFEKRLPDWDLALVVVSELHSAVEGLWHGIDRNHPLHGRAPSTKAAGLGLLAVYAAVDRLVGNLVEAFPDAIVIAFTMNGMGINHSDNASMMLLPELLFRHTFGRTRMRLQGPKGPNPEMPILAEDQGWGALMRTILPDPPNLEPFVNTTNPRRLSLDWMPATRYRPYWPRMLAFALPSFYDGRVRINLAGREAQGIVPIERFAAVRLEISRLVRDCRNSITGEPAVRAVEPPSTPDPRRLQETESDLTFVWNGPTLGLDHPRLGRIGPMPFRRPGGHSGRYGMMWVAGPGVPSGDVGVTSSFDVAPTIVDLLGQPPVAGMSGRSLLRPGGAQRLAVAADRGDGVRTA